MARNVLFAIVAALCLSATLAASKTKEPEYNTTALAYAIEGSNLTISGAMSLAEGGYLTDDATELVMEVGEIAYNQTLLFIEQYQNATNTTVEPYPVKVKKGVLGGLEAMADGNELVSMSNDAINDLNKTEFQIASNTTYFYTMQKITDNLVVLTKAVEDSFADESTSAESTGNRKLLQSSNCDEDSSDAELQQCFLDTLRSTSNALSTSSDNTYTRQYDYYCEPYIRATFSDDLEDDLDDDKTMKTCNDFSFFGVFGATRCSECISHFSEDIGGLLTQEDCDTFSADEQKWYLDETDGKFMMRNDEEDNHCVTAPTVSSLYSSQYYTMQKCDKSNKAQHFDVLELDTMTGDPRIVMRLSGSDSKSLPGGMCMTTLEDDDDDEMPFVSKPCICAKSQIIARDD